MKADSAFIEELQNLLVKYEGEVNKSLEEGDLEPSTAGTYLLHSNNFVKWCKDDFVPGERNRLRKLKKLKIK